MQKYGWCLICANSQKQIDLPCSECGNKYIVARDVNDYEVHLYDLYDQNPDGVKPGIIHEDPGSIPPNDPKYHDYKETNTPSSLPPANKDLRPIGSNKDVKDTELHGQDPLQDLQSGEAKTKKVDGKNLPASAFAVVKDANDPSTWHFPIHDAKHVRLAVQMWDKANPENKTAEGHKKIMAAAKKFGIHVATEADRQVIDQVRETWTRTGDPKTTRLTLWEKNVQNIDVDPKNYSTNNDGHERPADSTYDPGKAVPAPVGGSMNKEKTTVAVYPGKPGREQPDAFMDPHADGPTTKEELEPVMKTPPPSETQKVYPGNPSAKPGTYMDPLHNADYQDNVHKDTKNDSFMDPGPQGTTEDPRMVKNEKAAPGTQEDQPMGKPDSDPHHPKPDVDMRNLRNYSKSDNPDEKSVKPEGNIDQAKTEANPDGKAPAAPMKNDSFMDPGDQGTTENPSIVKANPDRTDLKSRKPADAEDAGHRTNNQPSIKHDVTKHVPGAPPVKTVDNNPKHNITDDQAKIKEERRAAKARMQKYLKPADNYMAPNKRGNSDLLPNIGLDEEKPNFSKPTFQPHADGTDMMKDDKTSVGQGVPTTRTPAGDNINDHYVELTDKDGAPTQAVPSATNLNTQYGVITPKVRTDENRTVTVTEGDDFKGEGDKPGDSTTRGPDADQIDTNKTVQVKDVDKTQDLEDRKVKGQKAVNVLRFSKAFWKSSEGVLAFLANEGIDYAYRIDASGKVVSKITDTAGYFEVEALPAEFFLAGTMVEHCIANFGGDCAIVAVSGEVKATPEPRHLPYGTKVNTLAVSTKVQASFVDYHVKRVAILEAELQKAQGRLKGMEETLVSLLDDKTNLTEELRAAKADIANRIAQAKLDARMNEVPSVVKAKLKRNGNIGEILKYMRTASDEEWELARHTLALANNTSFTELSEKEGKLPVGGGSVNEDSKNLKEYLR